MSTEIENIRAMAEKLSELLASPREILLTTLTAYLNAAYQEGRKDEGYLTKMKEAKAFENGWKAAKKDI
jgi:hypothetical protein